MNENLFHIIDQHLIKEDFTAALIELTSVESQNEPTVIALKAQVMRAAGKHNEAMDLIDRHWHRIIESETALLRILPAIVSEGMTSELESRLEDIASKSPGCNICDCLWSLKAMVDDCPKFLRILQKMAKEADYESMVTELEEALTESVPIPRLPATDDTIGAMLKLFAGNPAIHAKQCRIDERWGYVPMRYPLSPENLAKHINEEVTLGVYPLRTDGTVWFAAVDVDIKKSFIPAMESDLFRTGIFEAAETATISIAKELIKADIPVFIEFSGYKGFHIWTFFSEPVEAALVRKLWHKICAIDLPQPVAIEIFPKQDKLKDGMIGNLIKLPSGLHNKSGKRSCWVTTDELAYVKNQEEYLLSIQRLQRHSVLDIAEKFIHRERQLSDTQIINEFGEPAKVAGVGPIPEEVVIVGETPNAIKRILNGCKVISTVCSRITSTHTATSAEQHVLAYIFGVLGDEGKLYVHRLAQHILDYDSAKWNKKLRSIPPNPMSCPKVRKWLPQQAMIVGCRCAFNLPPKGYPSPLCHADMYPMCSEKVIKKNKGQYAKTESRLSTPSNEPARQAEEQAEKPPENNCPPHKLLALPERTEPSDRGYHPSHQVKNVAATQSESVDDLMTEFYSALQNMREVRKALDQIKARLDPFWNGLDGEYISESGIKYVRKTTESGLVRFERPGKRGKGRRSYNRGKNRNKW